MEDNADSEKKQQQKQHRYWWIKLKDNFFQQESIKIIESQENGARYIVFYLKLLLLAIGKTDVGILRYNENIPYDAKILSTVTDTDFDTVRSALEIFQTFDLIKIMENGDIWIEDAVRMVDSESASAIRVRKHRAKQKEIENKSQSSLPLQCNEDIEQDIEQDLDLDIDKEREREGERESERERESDKNENPLLSQSQKKQTVKEGCKRVTEMVDKTLEGKAVRDIMEENSQVMP